MHIVINNNMLVESQRAIEQAAGVAKLTRLAFFYIPLSFTTSFFGMNFVQFGTGELSIWLWFAVSIPIFFVSVLFLAVDLPALAKVTWLRMSERFMRKSI
jgi:Mg2+ and Co2+ transporter CorA